MRSVTRAALAALLAFQLAACGGSSEADGGGPAKDAKGDVLVGEAVFTPQPLLGTWLLAVDAHQSNFNFYLYLPETYDTGTEAYPVVIHLHGDDGNNLVHTRLNPWTLSQGPLAPLVTSTGALDPAARQALNGHVRNAFVVYPEVLQIDRSGSFRMPLGYWNPNALNKIVDYLAQNYRIDRSRLYVTGLSMGGGGTFHYAQTNPEKVAAIVPICNGLYANRGGADLKGIPVWLFHSYNDPVVSLGSAILPTLSAITSGTNFLKGYPYGNSAPAKDYTVSYRPESGLGPWLEGSKQADGLVNFTLYASGGHNAWDRAYANDVMWDWLFAQTNVR